MVAYMLIDREQQLARVLIGGADLPADRYLMSRNITPSGRIGEIEAVRDGQRMAATTSPRLRPIDPSWGADRPGGRSGPALARQFRALAVAGFDTAERTVHPGDAADKSIVRQSIDKPSRRHD
jgi:hypothetical protein